MTNLRKDIIRLAYAHPDLRATLLPLVQAAQATASNPAVRRDSNEHDSAWTIRFTNSRGYFFWVDSESFMPEYRCRWEPNRSNSVKLFQSKQDAERELEVARAYIVRWMPDDEVFLRPEP